jgi:STE24 endopeptidase
MSPLRISGCTAGAKYVVAKRGQMVRVTGYFLWLLFVVAMVMAASSEARAKGSNSSQTPNALVAGDTASEPAFDANAAVETYLAKMPPAERARSNAYFEGGYWLQLWDFLSTVVVMWLLLRFRWSTRIRDFAERVTRFCPLQTAVYWLQFIVVATVATFPLTIYESYIREHKYGLSNQDFGQWMRDQAVMLGVGIVLGAILIMPLFGLVRHLGKNWWVWGAVATMVFIAFFALIAPVYIAPLFNKYTKLQDPSVKDPILSMARANGIPATDVYEFDASRQSNRVSANVSGFAGSLRISLNDNLLKRCTLPEIETTMGHEMGHYVLNHIYKSMMMYGVVTVIGFAFLSWGINFALSRWGLSWGVRDSGDIAVLPLAVIVLSLYLFVATPINNTIMRTMEFEADMYGLNAARQPDAEANVDLLLGEYRKMDPGPIEEFVFFDHPSGRTRLTAAIRWKAEHPETASQEELARPMFTTP